MRYTFQHAKNLGSNLADVHIHCFCSRFHRDENWESEGKSHIYVLGTCEKHYFELLFENALLFLGCLDSIEWTDLLEHSILLLTVVISCVLQRKESFLGAIDAPCWNVGTTLLWSFVVSVIWCTIAEKVSLRAQHCGRESLI